MKTNTISVSYIYNYMLDFANNYVFTSCGKCFNSQTGREIKKVLNGYTLGYNIKGKFYSLKKLRNHLVKPQEIDCPF